MRKIIVGAQVSMDGVMQAPGGPTEDPTQGSRAAAGRCPLAITCSAKSSAARPTRFSPRTGPYDDDASHGGIAKRFNASKKYAVSRAGEVDTRWAGAVLLRDLADVKRLKQEDGPSLVTQGSTELVHALLAADLVDAISLFTMPVVLGGGKKLFADGSAPHSFALTRSRVSSNGLIVGHYERHGDVEIGSAPALDSPSARETARRERMQREG